jgi:phenylalanyl-tRNA synthetase beta chain
MRLRLRTEASARFEKALDPDLPPIVARRFIQLLRQVAPGSSVMSKLRDVYAGRPPLPVIDTSVAYINERLGTSLPTDAVVNMLEALEFSVTATDGNLRAVVPGHRATKDVSIADDLVEEVGRLYGYGNIVPVHPRAPMPKPYRDPTLTFHHHVRTALTFTTGMTEVQTYSFDPEPMLSRIGLPAEPRVAVRNPIGADLAYLRSRLLPSALSVLERNRGVADHLRVYEIGRVFHPSDGIPDQPYHLALLTWHRNETDWRTAQTGAVADLKAALAQLSARLRVSLRFVPALQPHQWLHPVRVADVQTANGTVVGHVGALHPRLCDALESGPFVGLAEINLDLLQVAERDLPMYEPVVRFPPLPVDISLVVPYHVTHQQIVSTIEEMAIPTLPRIEFIGWFTGDPIPAGRKSMTYRLHFQSPERTLSKDEVLADVDNIRKFCAERYGASTRT